MIETHLGCPRCDHEWSDHLRWWFGQMLVWDCRACECIYRDESRAVSAG